MDRNESLQVTIQFEKERDLLEFVKRVIHSGTVTTSSYVENELPAEVVELRYTLGRRQLGIELCCPVSACSFGGEEEAVHSHIRNVHGYLYSKRYSI